MAVRIEWNRRGFRAVLMSSPVRDELARRARLIAAASGGEGIGYQAVTGTGKTRARAAVVAASIHAQRHNAKQNTILRNHDAGRQ